MKKLLILFILVGVLVSGCAEKKADEITTSDPKLNTQIEKTKDSFSCDGDEDCVLDTWEEGVCCDSGCLNYAINTSEYERRIQWRKNNCDENETSVFYEGVRNGSLRWDNVPSKWAPCFIEEDQCGPEGFFKEAYCDDGICKGRK